MSLSWLPLLIGSSDAEDYAILGLLDAVQTLQTDSTSRGDTSISDSAVGSWGRCGIANIRRGGWYG